MTGLGPDLGPDLEVGLGLGPEVGLDLVGRT